MTNMENVIPYRDDEVWLHDQSTDTVEYAIMMHHRGEIHRGPETLEWCQQWINEWIADGGNPDTFYLVKRKVESWKLVYGATCES